MRWNPVSCANFRMLRSSSPRLSLMNGRHRRLIQPPHVQLGGHIYRNNLLSAPDVQRKGMTTARVEHGYCQSRVESRWSPNLKFPAVGVQLASKFHRAKSSVFSKRSLQVVDISCLGCKRSRVQILAARPIYRLE